MTHKRGLWDDRYWYAYEWGHNKMRLGGNTLNRFASDYADACSGLAQRLPIALYYQGWSK